MYLGYVVLVVLAEDFVYISPPPPLGLVCRRLSFAIESLQDIRHHSIGLSLWS